MDENNIQLFENKRIRTAWDEEKQEWFFSIKEEGSELVSYTNQLKMTDPDGKMRLTDVADARKAIEADTGKPVITSQNAVDFSHLVTNLIESTDDKGDKKPE